ncbi:MAG TPA: glycosyltransferase family 39 protein, partial [Pyrinomonadaceae bacterium]
MSVRTRLIIAAICIAYVAARIWRLSDSCLWFDELFSVHAAEHGWGSLFSFVAKDLIHPPLFYILLKLWISLGGESVFWLRLLPVLFSVLALIPFIYLCRELKLRPPVIILSLGLMAVNGALIKYTQTLRMYSMLMFLALMSMWLFARYFSRGKSLLALIIVNVLLVYTHYFGWLIIASEITAIFIYQRIKWRGTLLMSGVAVVSFVPWLIAVWQAQRAGSSLSQNIAWQTQPGIRELFTFVTDLVEPFYFQASNVEPASIYLLSVPLVIVFVAAMIEYSIKFVRKEEKRPASLLGLFVLVPLLLAFAASWILPHSVWGTRHLIVVFPPLMVLFADAVLSFHLRVVRIGAIALIVALTVFALVRDVRREMPRHVWCAWNDVAEDIKARATAGDKPETIYTFENLVAYHMWFALRHTEGIQIAVVKGVDVQTADETYFLPRGFEDVRRA